MFSRFTAVLAIYFLPYIRENGMSTLAKQEFTLTQLLFSSLMVGLAALLFPSGLLLLGTAFVGLLLFTFWFKRRFGGFSGDLYGFMIEMSELILMHVLLVGALL
jgi:cobalamin synthase